MCSTTCDFDDASLLPDEPVIIETTESASIVVVEDEEEEERVEGVGKIQNTIDSTMCNTACIFDDASFMADELAMIKTTETASSAAAAEEDEEEEESLGGVWKMNQFLLYSDNAQVNAILDALSLDLDKSKENCDTFTVLGGCAALVHLLKDRLKKAMKKILECDQVTEVTELLELATLENTLRVITRLTYYTDDMGKVGIATVGGVEAVVDVMKTFPKCQTLQERACNVLLNLASCSINKAKAIESGGIEVLLAAINNHLGSAILCRHACWALMKIARGSKENKRLLISLGGGDAVAKVRTRWPDNYDAQPQGLSLANLIVAEMKAWASTK